MSESEILERIRKAKIIIKRIRSKKWFRDPTKIKEKYPLTYGFYGFLEWIETGNQDITIESNIRYELEQLLYEISIKNQSKSLELKL